jgi:hypothetical protein
MDKFEELRFSFKPEFVKILFIAESRPAGGTFFYCANSNLYYTVKLAFEETFKKSFGKNDFLDFFKEKKCFLDDLCSIPVNSLSDLERIEERIKGMKPLEERLKTYKPEIVVILMKDIADCVVKVIKDSKIDNIKHIQITPFPVRSEQNKINCKNGIKKALSEALLRNIIHLSS